MTQEEFDKAPKLDQILYDTTGMLVKNNKSIKEAMQKYAEWLEQELSERQSTEKADNHSFCTGTINYKLNLTNRKKMEAKNLRIGNKVDLYGNTATIQGADFVKHYSAGNENFDRFKPIKLTEELLRAFGFVEFSQNTGFPILHKSKFVLERGRKSDAWYFYFGESEIVVVKYVHKLQNLFFAIMNKELELEVLM